MTWEAQALAIGRRDKRNADVKNDWTILSLRQFTLDSSQYLWHLDPTDPSGFLPRYSGELKDLQNQMGWQSESMMKWMKQLEETFGIGEFDTWWQKR